MVWIGSHNASGSPEPIFSDSETGIPQHKSSPMEKLCSSSWATPAINAD